MLLIAVVVLTMVVLAMVGFGVLDDLERIETEADLPASWSPRAL